MVPSNVVDEIELESIMVTMSTFLDSNKWNLRRSRLSSRIISSSRDASPFDHVSTQVSHVCSSSINVQGRVQSRTIIMRV